MNVSALSTIAIIASFPAVVLVIESVGTKYMKVVCALTIPAYICVALTSLIIMLNVNSGKTVSTCYDIEFSNNIKKGDFIEVNGEKVEIDEVVFTDDKTKTGIYKEKHVWEGFYDDEKNIAYIYKGKE